MVIAKLAVIAIGLIFVVILALAARRGNTEGRD